MEKPMNNCEMIRRKWIQLTLNAFNEKSLTASQWMWQEMRAHDHLMHCKVDALEKEVKELNAEIADMLPVVQTAKNFCQEHHPGCSNCDCTCRSSQCRFNRAVVTYFGEDAVYPIPEEGE